MAETRLDKQIVERKRLLGEREQANAELLQARGQMREIAAVLDKPTGRGIDELADLRSKQTAISQAAATLDAMAQRAGVALDSNLNRVNALRAQIQNARAEATQLEDGLAAGALYDRRVAEAEKALTEAKRVKVVVGERLAAIRANMAALGDPAELKGVNLAAHSRGRVSLTTYFNLEPVG